MAPLISTEGAIAAVIALLAGESLSPGVGIALAIVVGRRVPGVGAARGGTEHRT